MILANVRASLGREDAQLALQLLARGSRSELERAEGRLRDEGLDALLDDPRLLAAFFEHPLGARVSLPLFCYVVVRQALRARGETDRVLCDYVAAILLHFSLKDRFTRIADSDDERYDTLAALLDATDGPDARRNFLARAHLGNYALWLSGLFPDRIEHRHWRRGGPDLGYYEEMGKRGFQLAADHRLAQEHGLAMLYAEAADRFGALRVALNSVSDSLLFPTLHTPERLMRQVRDEVNWRLS
ncbi:MAG TPA: hypothetical protein VJ812_11000 [Gemmatimonadaceae bacterium]|jgi:hypothetical protein|nr:hypothetical protein [Gemmatimonadaceae bacterium]